MSRMPAVLADGRAGRLAALALLALGQAAAAGAAAIAVRDMFGQLSEGAGARPTAALATVVAAGFAFAALRWGERVGAERLGHDYANALRVRVFSHLARMPADALAGRRTGSLSLRFVGDLGAVRAWIGQGVVRLLCAGIVFVAIAGVMFALDPAMGVAAAGSLLTGMLAMALLGAALPRLQRRLRRQRSRLAGDVAERLPYAAQLRLLGRLPHERRRLARLAARVCRNAVRRQRRVALLRALPEVAQAVAAALVLWIAFRNAAPPADAAAALAALALLTRPARDLAGVWDRYAAWRSARERCERLLQTPRVSRGNKVAVRLGPSTGPGVEVRFDRVTHGRINGLSATASPGRKVGITGPNGAGKSTLLAVAAGLVAPTRGRVRVAGVSPARADGSVRRRLLRLLSPGSPLLSGSLRRALGLGLRRRPPDAELRRVAERFGLGDLLTRAGGLDGRVAEGGRNLSTGEIRRLLLARTALADVPLLLLDEPDDALDQAGRGCLRDFVRRTPATVLLTSQDWATLSAMDEIWYLVDGRIVETGSPELLQNARGPAAQFLGLDCAA